LLLVLAALSNFPIFFFILFIAENFKFGTDLPKFADLPRRSRQILIELAEHQVLLKVPMFPEQKQA
jgi:hypothetical protein